jgi:hypothetical protein
VSPSPTRPRTSLTVTQARRAASGTASNGRGDYNSPRPSSRLAWTVLHGPTTALDRVHQLNQELNLRLQTDGRVAYTDLSRFRSLPLANPESPHRQLEHLHREIQDFEFELQNLERDFLNLYPGHSHEIVQEAQHRHSVVFDELAELQYRRRALEHASAEAERAKARAADIEYCQAQIRSQLMFCNRPGQLPLLYPPDDAYIRERIMNIKQDSYTSSVRALNTIPAGPQATYSYGHWEEDVDRRFDQGWTLREHGYMAGRPAEETRMEAMRRAQLAATAYASDDPDEIPAFSSPNAAADSSETYFLPPAAADNDSGDNFSDSGGSTRMVYESAADELLQAVTDVDPGPPQSSPAQDQGFFNMGLPTMTPYQLQQWHNQVMIMHGLGMEPDIASQIASLGQRTRHRTLLQQLGDQQLLVPSTPQLTSAPPPGQGRLLEASTEPQIVSPSTESELDLLAGSDTASLSTDSSPGGLVVRERWRVSSPDVNGLRQVIVTPMGGGQVVESQPTTVGPRDVDTPSQIESPDEAMAWACLYPLCGTPPDEQRRLIAARAAANRLVDSSAGAPVTMQEPAVTVMQVRPEEDDQQASRQAAVELSSMDVVRNLQDTFSEVLREDTRAGGAVVSNDDNHAQQSPSEGQILVETTVEVRTEEVHPILREVEEALPGIQAHQERQEQFLRVLQRDVQAFGPSSHDRSSSDHPSDGRTESSTSRRYEIHELRNLDPQSPVRLAATPPIAGPSAFARVFANETPSSSSSQSFYSVTSPQDNAFRNIAIRDFAAEVLARPRVASMPVQADTGAPSRIFRPAAPVLQRRNSILPLAAPDWDSEAWGAPDTDPFAGRHVRYAQARASGRDPFADRYHGRQSPRTPDHGGSGVRFRRQLSQSLMARQVASPQRPSEVLSEETQYWEAENYIALRTAELEGRLEPGPGPVQLHRRECQTHGRRYTAYDLIVCFHHDEDEDDDEDDEDDGCCFTLQNLLVFDWRRPSHRADRALSPGYFDPDDLQVFLDPRSKALNTVEDLGLKRAVGKVIEQELKRALHEQLITRAAKNQL